MNSSREIAGRLRRTFRIPVLPLPDRSCLVETQYAYYVLQLFPPGTEADWDPVALGLAVSQLEHRTIQTHARLDVQLALDDPASALSGYDRLPRLDAHQAEAAAAISARSLRGLALFDEQGTGKTISLLAGFDRLWELGLVERLLVIAPKSVLGAWVSDCHKLLGDKYRLSIMEGSPTRRRLAIRRAHNILIVNYELAVKELGILKILLSARPLSYMLAVDESYLVKNPATARAKAIAALRPYCERAVVLCGTPAPNSAIDIVNQITVADGGVAFGNVAIPKSDEAAEEVIRIALGDAIYIRRLKENVLPDLPSKEFERVYVDLQPIQGKRYEEARDDLILRIRSVDDREFSRQLASYMALRVALLQLCSHPGGLDPLYAEDPAKLLALDRILHELVEEQGEKVVIWSFFRHSLQAIADRYKRYGLVRIDGSVAKVEDRIDAINRFQTDSAIRVFLGNAAAAGAGITLTTARHAIYESFSNQAAHYMQSVDRIHRRGQERDVMYHVLLANDTIEEREFDRILHKERSARDLLGDHYKEPMTRDRFLTELGHSTHAIK